MKPHCRLIKFDHRRIIAKSKSCRDTPQCFPQVVLRINSGISLKQYFLWPDQACDIQNHRPSLHIVKNELLMPLASDHHASLQLLLVALLFGLFCL